MVDELYEKLSFVNLVEGRKDSWVWTKNKEGLFTVKSTYIFLQGIEESGGNRMFNQIWSCPVPTNATTLAWKILLNKVQTRDNLLKRKVIFIKRRPPALYARLRWNLFPNYSSLVENHGDDGWRF